MSSLASGLVIRAQYLEEPMLEFADGRTHVDPKAGIARFGPKSYSPPRRHPRTVRVGFIGTAESMAAAKEWMERTASGVAGDLIHPEFPGYMSDRGYFSQLEFSKDWQAQLTQSELTRLVGIRKSRVRFEETLNILESKVLILWRKEEPPQYIVVSMPDDLYRECRVVNYRDRHLGDVHRDLRRAFKAAAMKFQIPTQFLRQQTIDGRDRDHPSKIAWNFYTGLYFKAGGSPWGPSGLTPGTCYLGISFYRSLGSADLKMHTSLVQAFDEYGNGLALRGPEFQWDEDEMGTSSPHLDAPKAGELLTFALDRYEAEMRRAPQRVVLHKSSRFWNDERQGFTKVLGARVRQYDLMSLARQSRVRLLAASKYPPLRGTRFVVGDVYYLYTTGFLADLGQSHTMHVPSPLQITDHIGQDTPREVLLREILALTKMNWNSARMFGSLPITLRFSNLVGEIMREIPADRDPLPHFKFYM